MKVITLICLLVDRFMSRATILKIDTVFRKFSNAAFGAIGWESLEGEELTAFKPQELCTDGACIFFGSSCYQALVPMGQK